MIFVSLGLVQYVSESQVRAERIVRDFNALNFLPFSPTRSCVSRTGPGELSLMSTKTNKGAKEDQSGKRRLPWPRWSGLAGPEEGRRSASISPDRLPTSGTQAFPFSSFPSVSYGRY